MGQVTNGVRRVLSHPRVYDLFQVTVGAYRARSEVLAHTARITTGDTVVDIGCGTGHILDDLPRQIVYFGYDLSEEYIRTAKATYGDRASLECVDVSRFAVGPRQGTADVVLALGVLHHLDDDAAAELIGTAHDLLAPGGRLITLDTAYSSDQSRAARYLVSKDRGQDVRTPEGYRDLAEARFAEVHVEVRHDLLRIPYTLAIMECTR